jgi:hypothetical protein
MAAKFLLFLSSTAILGSESHGTFDDILLAGGSGSIQTTTHDYLDRVRARVTLRLTVYRQSGHPGDKPLDTHDQHFFFN